METENRNIDLDNPEFQNIYKLVKHTHRSIFMTGRAGTGKSTFLKYICANTTKRHVVLAPTGIAAVNVGGSTLHSFFKIPFKPLLPDDPEFAVDRLRKRLKYNKVHVKLIRELELIIIDEISMVRADLIDFVDKVLRVYCGRMREPFGGKQMLFVGDVFQLEPVVTSDMRDILRQYYPNSYFFSAKVFGDFSLVPIELRKVYRQTDERFVSLLDRFRIGSPTQSDVDSLNSRVSSTAPKNADGFTMTLATRRDMVDEINDNRLSQLKAAPISYYGEIVDDFPENSLPTSKELVLKTGAQVVFVKNDRDRRWVNGTVAKVYSATPDRLEIELENGDRHVVEMERWDNIVYKYDEESKKVIENVIGSFIQYPVRLAWALTIHKSQGLTFNNVIIDVGHGAFSGGQTYVALSRCTSLEGITLRSSVNQRDVFVSPSIVDFSRRFNDTSLVESALSDAKADDAYERSAKAFDNGDYGMAVDAFIEAVSARNELGRHGIDRLIKMKLAKLASLGDKIADLEAKLAADAVRFAKLADEYVAMGIDCLEDAGDFASAIANFNKALSLVERHPGASYQKGRALLLAGQPEDAIAAIADAVDAEPDNLKLLLLSADAYTSMGDLHNALDRLMKAEKIRPKSSDVHGRLASLYEEIGDEEAADHHRKLASRYRRNKSK